MPRVALLSFLCLTGLLAAAQNPLPFTWETAPILRMQHREFNAGACVLLRRNGDYHLERERRSTSTVYEGTLSKQQLAEVSEWLKDPTLLRFTQKDVVMPLISRNDEQVQIHILRLDHWQFLEFPDSVSRKPLEDSLAPLLLWLSNLHNLPARTLSEDEGKNNCLPPGQIELKHRPAPSAAEKVEPSAPPAAPAPVVEPPQRSYLLRFELDSFGPGTAERICLIVYPAGNYHAEKALQNVRSDMDTQIYEDKLGQDQMTTLARLLDEPVLRSLHHGNLPEGGQSSDITILSIPRADMTQQLRFAGNFSVWQGQRWVTTSHDPGMAPLDPIRQWVKTEFHFTKANRLKHASPNNCTAR